MTDLLTWEEIEQQDDYQADYQLLKSVCDRQFGDDVLAESVQQYVYVIVRIAAITRWKIKHIGDLRDLSKAPDQYLNLLKQEIGYGLPTSSAFPLVEFLRESRAWFAAKGSENLFGFIGELIGSPIALHYPKDLIFTLDDPRSCLDGADSGGVQLQWDQSDLAMLHDGVYWAKYVYIVDILQAQNVTFESDLINLLDAVHPAGTKRFIREFYNYFIPRANGIKPIVLRSYEKFTDFSLIIKNAPTRNLDGYFILDDPGSLLDGLFFDQGTLMTINVNEINRVDIVRRKRTLATDRLMHNFPQGQVPPTDEHAAFSRFIFDESLQQWVELFADNDAWVYENVTSNIGLNNFRIADLANFTMRHLQYCSFFKDKQNDDLMYLPAYPPIQITTSEPPPPITTDTPEIPIRYCYLVDH